MTEPNTIVPHPARRKLCFEGAGLTHVGRVRSINEDAILTDPSGVFWAIADGMGGHGHGDVASDIVIDCLSKMPDTGDAAGLIDRLLEQANSQILARSLAFGLGKIGATVIALKLEPRAAEFAWAGDCRGYLFRGGQLSQVTRDHSLVEDLVRDGLLNRENIRNHPNSNVVTRAVGADEVLDIDHVRVPLRARDRFLLCSDGLTACVDDPQILDLVYHASDPSSACKALVTAALEAGAPDNISVIVIFTEEA